MLIASLLAGLLLAAQSAPPADLQRALTLADAAARQRAAREIASGGATYEKWLLRQMGRGSPEERRALMIAAGLLGSPETLAELESLAVRGRKPDPQRAFALLIYGCFHPNAGADPEADWKRGVSSYERACLLTGLLARSRCFESDAWVPLASREPDSCATALLEVAEVLLGRAPPVRSTDPLSYSIRLVTSVLPLQPSITDFQIAESWGLPPAWVWGARHEPRRSFAELRSIPLAGTGSAIVLALPELDRSEQAPFFLWLNDRLQEPRSRAILWGLAGDLGLELPPSTSVALDPAEVAGLLALALQDPTQAERGAQARLPHARTAFRAASNFTELFPAALVLALAGVPEDHELLRARIEAADARERLELQPIWKYAQRSFGDVSLQREWQKLWARRLGAGRQGWIDLEGPRWAAYLLTGGTRAAVQDPRLQPRIPALEQMKHDYALDASLHSDVVEFLLSGSYRWSFPE